jgi:hypothetical protein
MKRALEGRCSSILLREEINRTMAMPEPMPGRTTEEVAFRVETGCPYGDGNSFNSLGPFSSSFIGDPVLSPMDGCDHPPLYLSGTGRASQKTAILPILHPIEN